MKLYSDLIYKALDSDSSDLQNYRYGYIISKIKLRDIYGAFYELQSDSFSHMKDRARVDDLVNAAINTIKKKDVEALKLLNQVLVNKEYKDFVNEPEEDEVFNIALKYIAYCYFNRGDHEKAVGVYNLLEKKNCLEEDGVYNRHLCSAIILAKQGEYSSSEMELKKAMMYYPNEPKIILSILEIIRFIIINHEEFDRLCIHPHLHQPFKQDLFLVIFSAIQTLESIEVNLDSYFYLQHIIGMLKVIIELEHEAISNFSLAIQRNLGPPNAEFYYWRGLSFAISRNYKKGISDFERVLNMDPTFGKAATAAARSFLNCGDLSSALYILERAESGTEQSRNIRYWLGCFFLSNSIPTHAETFFLEALSIKEDELALHNLYLCNMLQKDLSKAMKILARLIEICPKSTGYKVDSDMLCSLQTLIREPEQGLKLILGLKGKGEGVVFRSFDIRFFEGVALCINQRFHSGLRTFEALRKDIDKDDIEGISDILNKTNNEDNEEGIYTEESINSVVAQGRTIYYPELLYNIYILHLILGDQKTASQYLSMINSQLDGLNYSHYPSIFISSNRFCSTFPFLRSPEGSSECCYSLSFCLPSLTLPSLLLSADLRELNSLTIDSLGNHPEAPWTNREKGVFTFVAEKQELELQEVTQFDQLQSNSLQESGWRMPSNIRKKVEMEIEHWGDHAKKKEDAQKRKFTT